MKALAAGFVILLAVAAAWLAWRSPGAAVAGEGDARVGAEATAAPAATSQPLAASQPLLASRVPVPGSRPASGPQLTVLVVDKATGSPVPGAEVLWFDPRTRLPELDADEARRLEADREAMARRCGTGAFADAEGRVRLPRPERQTAFVGRLGDTYGEAWLEAMSPPGELRLELARDRSLEILVVDPRGRPRGGVKVGFTIMLEGKPPLVFNLGVTSAAAGSLVVPHFDLWLGTWLRGADPGQGVKLGLQAIVLGAVAPRVDVDTKALPERVVLTLPPIGSVRASCVDTVGKPARMVGGQADAVLLPEPERITLVSGAQAVGFSAPDGSDHVFFPVALGIRLRVTVSGWGIQYGLTELLGPTTEEQEVRVELRPSPESPILRGRAVDERQRPLANATLSIAVASGKEQNGGFRALTDASGSFECAIHRDWAKRRLEGFEWGVLDGPNATGLTARVPVPFDLDPGVKELGTLVFTMAPLIVAGTCVDGAGAPLPEAQVLLVLAGSADARSPARPAGVVRTRAGGGFGFRGDDVRGELRLRATCEGRVSVPGLAFERGATDVKIVLERAGMVEGTALHEPGLGPLLRLVFRREDEREPKALEGRLIFTRAKDGDDRRDASRFFSFVALRPGSYRLEFSLLGDATPLAALSGVAVREGETSDDPRLAEVDLRGRLRIVRLAFTASDGRAVDARGGVVFAGGVADGRRVGYEVKDAKCDVPAVRLPVDLRVSVPGYVPQELRGVDADREVRLERQRAIAVELEGLDQEALGKAGLELVLRRVDAKPASGRYEIRSSSWWSQSIEGEEPADKPTVVVADQPSRRVVHVPALGEYAIECKVVGPGPQRWPECALERFSPRTVRVGADTASFRVTLDPDELRQRVRELTR